MGHPWVRFAVAALSFTISAIPVLAAMPRPGSFEQSLLAHTNAERRREGRLALVWSDDLAAAARTHARDMLKRRFFAHESPERKGPSDRVRANATEAIVLDVRENLARSKSSDPDSAAERAAEIVDGWMRSRGHRENLLNADSTHVGFGSASERRGGLFLEIVVQVLGIVAGRWEDVPPAVTRAPAVWRARLSSPLEFFLEDTRRPDRQYPDPRRASFYWRGGVPLRVSRASGASRVQLPSLDPGLYRLLARRAGRKGYTELLAIRIRR